MYLKGGTSSLTKEVYNPKTFIPHAASLGQGFPHCPKFPTAASRRSGARISVPLWPVSLSARLPVIGLVGHYPTNYLIGHGPILNRSLRSFFLRGISPQRKYWVLATLSHGCPHVKGKFSVYYSPVCR
jgi:hypothetical protein